MWSGLPHPSLFPFQAASISTYPASTVLNEAGIPQGENTDLIDLKVSKIERAEQLLSLSTALQYGLYILC